MAATNRVAAGLALSLGLCLAPTPTRAEEDPGRAGWVRVYGVEQETLHVLDGRTFRGGFLVGTSAARAPDGTYLAAGYVRAYEGHPVDLAVIRVNADGTVRWYREYGPAPGRPPAMPTMPSDAGDWADVAADRDGGAVVAYGSTILWIDAGGTPRRALELVRGTDATDGSVRVTTLRTLADGGLALAGIDTPPAGSQRPTAAFAARVDAEGGVVWARRYAEARPSRRPGLVVRLGGDWVLGSEPSALLFLSPGDGAPRAGRSIEPLAFARGPRTWRDVGVLLRYRSLGVAPGGDLVYGGLYDLSHPTTYRAPGAFVARLSPDGSTVRWTRRLHDPAHGGQGAVHAVEIAGDDILLVGTSTAFGASHAYQNPNLLAAKLSGAGDLRWIGSFGKKKLSAAQSEYADDRGFAAASTPDGGLLAVGATNGFAHPDPGFHQVVEWARPHDDLLLARFGPDGTIANLPAGRHPRVHAAPDVLDPTQVDVTAPPIAARSFEPASEPLVLKTRPTRLDALEGTLQSHFSTAGDGTIGPATTGPPTCTVALSEGGRVMSTSCPILVPADRTGDPGWDPDGDGLLQDFEDAAIDAVNPRLELDEEEDWLKHRTEDPVHNFVRVALWRPPPPRPDAITLHPVDPDLRYVIMDYAITWARDYGRFANQTPELVAASTLPRWVPAAVKAQIADALRDAARDYTREHPGDVEHAVFAWRVESPVRLRLTHVYTTAHGGETTGHSGAWAAEGRTRVRGRKMHYGLEIAPHVPTIEDARVVIWDLGELAGGEDWMEEALAFDPDGVLRLFPSEDKHAIYPTAACGEGVTLIEVDFFADVGEDCGGGGTFRFDCVNIGEPEGRLVDDLDAPATWRHVTPAQRRALEGKFPGEQVWSGNKELLRLSAPRPGDAAGEPRRKFLGGKGVDHAEDGPSPPGAQAADFPVDLVQAIPK